MMQLIEGREKHADRILHCSEYTRQATCLDCGTKYWAGTSVCKSRYCNVCSRRRYLAYVRRYKPVFDRWVQSDPTRTLKFVTLTLKSQENLGEMLDTLNWHFKRFREDYPLWTQLVEGGVVSREIKRGKDGWHVHMHMIICAKGWLEKKDLQAAWLQRTGDSYIADVRAVWGGDKSYFELFKYILKLSSLETPADLDTVMSTIHRRRLVSAFGCMYGKVTEEQVEEDVVGKLDLIGEVCRVCGCTEYHLQQVLTWLMSPLIDSIWGGSIKL